MEDYLRCIYEITERRGFIRVKDVARELNVKPSTVVGMLKKMDHKGFIRYEKYGGIVLTQQGKEISKAIKERHDTFKRFLKIILVPEDIALKDSHILEHYLDPKTILQFTRFVRFITESSEHPRFIKKWMEQFREYCEKEDRYL